MDKYIDEMRYLYIDREMIKGTNLHLLLDTWHQSSPVNRILRQIKLVFVNMGANLM